MTWTSPWVWVWAVAWLATMWLLPRRWRTAGGVVCTAAFIAWVDSRALAITGSALLSVWMMMQVLQSVAARLTVSLIIGALALAAVRLVPWDGALPAIGVAFAVVRLVCAAVEHPTGRQPTLMAVLSHICFMPTVIAGPIQGFTEHHREEGRRRWDTALASAGLERILIGAFKIIVLSGWVSYKLEFVDRSSWDPTASAWFACLHYGWDLWAQFSGYSDIAIGLAALIGHRLPENFRAPWTASDIQDFWRRWHATLSQWCRQHIAEPVLVTTRSRVLAAVGAMLVLGLWHEYSLRYVAWGLFHGAGIALHHQWRTWRGDGPRGRVEHVSAILLTQGFVITGFAITSSNDVSAAWARLQLMYGFGG